MARSLADFTVIDFTSGQYGAVTSEYLALTGMNVIRVGDPSDKAMTKEDKYVFIVNNLNKKCVTIDVKTPEGKKLMLRLLEKADVFVHNRTAAEMKELGLAYEDIKQTYPKLVYCNVPPYGTGSPWQDMPYSESTVSAMGGGTYLCGYIGGVPVEPGPDLPDISSSGYAVTGICCALVEREQTGEGQYVEVPMQEAVIAHARSAFESYANNGHNYRVGNAFPTVPTMVPMDIFKTKGGDDEFAVIGSMTRMFEPLFKAMDRADVITDPRFADPDERFKNKDALTQIIADWAKDHTKWEVMDIILRQNRCIASAVYTIKDLTEAEDLRDMGLIQKVEDPELGEMWYPAFSAIYSDIDIKAKSPVGADAGNEEVLKGLGLSADEIADLGAKKIV